MIGLYYILNISPPLYRHSTLKGMQEAEKLATSLVHVVSCLKSVVGFRNSKNLKNEKNAIYFVFPLPYEYDETLRFVHHQKSLMI